MSKGARAASAGRGGVAGVFDVLGIANVAATVQVNNQPVYRRAQYFWKEVAVNNANNAV